MEEGGRRGQERDTERESEKAYMAATLSMSRPVKVGALSSTQLLLGITERETTPQPRERSFMAATLSCQGGSLALHSAPA